MADIKTEKTVAEELREAARHIRENARGTAAGPWKAAPVWSPDSASTSAVYSHAYPTGTVESEVVASGQKRYRKGGLRNPCNARWIALMNPDLAEPLAALLEHMADIAEFAAKRGLRTAAAGQVEHALAVARVLNGTAVPAPSGDAPSGPQLRR
ncbi:hypothetical protein ABT294_00735 [Nonomuraea sp. NPDC000554]|uniref:hypothetical protein n=1 Tax=Nonomuraea sp. NPDC000554 TaxID=3154259 RepID=UPI00332DF2A4